MKTKFGISVMIVSFLGLTQSSSGQMGMGGYGMGGMGYGGGGNSADFNAMSAFMNCYSTKTDCPFGAGTSVKGLDGVSYNFPTESEESIVQNLVYMSSYSETAVENMKSNSGFKKYFSDSDLDKFIDAVKINKNFGTENEIKPQKSFEENLKLLNSLDSKILKSSLASTMAGETTWQTNIPEAERMKMLEQILQAAPGTFPMTYGLSPENAQKLIQMYDPNQDPNGKQTLCMMTSGANYFYNNPPPTQSSTYTGGNGYYNGQTTTSQVGGMSLSAENRKKFKDSVAQTQMALIKNHINHGTDLSYRCGSGLSLSEEIQALMKNYTNDADMSESIKAEAANLFGENNSVFGQSTGCDGENSAPMDLSDLKGLCDLSSSLGFLSEQARKQQKAGVAYTASSSSNRCSITSSYSVNNELIMDGKLTIMDLYSRDKKVISLKKVSFEDYRKAIRKAEGY